MNDLTTIIASITALCAVLLGPLVSIWGVQKHARVTVLSNNRQAWINTLRDLIAEFISICALIHSAKWNVRAEREFDEKWERLALVDSKIRLLLNPNEEDHNHLVKLMGDARRTLKIHATNEQDERFPEWLALSAELLPLAQTILKREWARVKRQK
jgi:hypothetical protein